MKIIVGSKNPSKIKAVEKAAKDYAFLKRAQVLGVEVISGVSEQPLSMEETIRGAKNRARNAFKKVKADYAIGIESGFVKIAGAKSGYIENSVCAIYGGKDFALGVSPGFECPPKVMELVLKKGLNLNDACFEAGISKDKEIGKREGIVGFLTKGRKTRSAYTHDAIIMALIHLENKELY
jgi:inosine/xanthosine triphosphatase